MSISTDAFAMLAQNDEQDVSRNSTSSHNRTSSWDEPTAPMRSKQDSLVHGFSDGHDSVAAPSPELSSSWTASFNPSDLLNMTSSQLQSLVVTNLDPETMSQLPYEYFEQGWQALSPYSFSFADQTVSRKLSDISENGRSASADFSKPELPSHSSTESHISQPVLLENEHESIGMSFPPQNSSDKSYADVNMISNVQHETDESRERRRTQNRIAQRLYRKRKEQALQDRDEEITSLKLQLEREKKLNQTLSRLLELFKENMGARREELRQNKHFRQNDVGNDKPHLKDSHFHALLANLNTGVCDDTSNNFAETSKSKSDMKNEQEAENPKRRLDVSGKSNIEKEEEKEDGNDDDEEQETVVLHSAKASKSDGDSRLSQDCSEQNPKNSQCGVQRLKRQTHALSTETIPTLRRPFKVMRQDNPR